MYHRSMGLDPRAMKWQAMLLNSRFVQWLPKRWISNLRAKVYKMLSRRIMAIHQDAKLRSKVQKAIKDQTDHFDRIGLDLGYFLPVGGQVWIPNAPRSNTIPCVKIETYVNGKVRQSQTTDNMIYTPLEMLRFIAQKYPMNQLKRGDMVLTGTPGGVAIATPRALVRLSNLLGFDRYKKLSIKQGGDLSGFLKAGDIVEVSGEGLGKIRTKIVLD